MINSISYPDYWFVFQNDLLLLTANDNNLLTSHTIDQLKPHLLHVHSIARRDQSHIYCAELDKNFSLPESIQAMPLRQAFNLLGIDWYTLMAKAILILQWDKNHHFCGRCGSLTRHREGTFERICPVCGLAFYPRISPSIIVLIHRQKEILMARSPHFTPGAYGLIAGFVEPGESCEEAVHREVKEEVGVYIKNLRYFGSQPWPFPDSLIIAYMAEYESGDLIIDRREIEAAGWYRYDNLPGRPSYHISMASKLIDHFIHLQQQQE